MTNVLIPDSYNALKTRLHGLLDYNCHIVVCNTQQLSWASQNAGHD